MSISAAAADYSPGSAEQQLADAAEGQAQVLVTQITGLPGHILQHAEVDEPSGTWTGAACPRHGRPLGTDVHLADLGAARRQAGSLLDSTWYAPEAIAALHVRLVRDMRADSQLPPQRRQHSADWWDNRIKAAWSYIWSANLKFVASLDRVCREQRGAADGALVASFEHNSSEHGLEWPHVHNLQPMLPGSGGR